MKNRHVETVNPGDVTRRFSDLEKQLMEAGAPMLRRFLGAHPMPEFDARAAGERGEEGRNPEGLDG